MNNKSKISFQNFGSSIKVFIEGNTPEDAYNQWVSMGNWGATSLLSGENPPYVGDNIVVCWSTLKQLKKYLFTLRIMELWDTVPAKFKGKKDGFKNEAIALANADYEAIEKESFRSVNNSIFEYSFGSIEGVRPDEKIFSENS